MELGDNIDINTTDDIVGKMVLQVYKESFSYVYDKVNRHTWNPVFEQVYQPIWDGLTLTLSNETR